MVLHALWEHGDSSRRDRHLERRPEDWDVVHVHDGMSCTSCIDRGREAGEEPVIGTSGAFDGTGSPTYGIPPALPD